MPLIPGTRPAGGGKPIKMPLVNNEIPGKFLKAKNQEELEYASLEDEEAMATKDWVENNYNHTYLDGGNF